MYGILSVFVLISFNSFLLAEAEIRPLFTRGVRVLSPQIQSRAVGDPVCSKLGKQCADDCSMLLTCIGKPEPIQNQTCASINSNTPYCVNNQCSDKPDVNNKNCTKAFVCTSEGVFPDPSDCTSYHYCPAADKESELYRCTDGYVFNSKTKLCRRKDSPSFCDKIDCSRANNDIVLLKSNPAYYALCFNGTNGQNQIYMFKCLDDENSIYDLKTDQCKYKCPGNGNFVDRTNCHGYIICAKRNGVLEGIPQNCTTNYWFKNGKCEKETPGALCTPEIPPVPPATLK